MKGEPVSDALKETIARAAKIVGRASLRWSSPARPQSPCLPAGTQLSGSGDEGDGPQEGAGRRGGNDADPSGRENGGGHALPGGWSPAGRQWGVTPGAALLPTDDPGGTPRCLLPGPSLLRQRRPCRAPISARSYCPKASTSVRMTPTSARRGTVRHGYPVRRLDARTLAGRQSLHQRRVHHVPGQPVPLRGHDQARPGHAGVEAVGARREHPGRSSQAVPPDTPRSSCHAATVTSRAPADHRSIAARYAPGERSWRSVEARRYATARAGSPGGENGGSGCAPPRGAAIGLGLGQQRQGPEHLDPGRGGGG